MRWLHALIGCETLRGSDNGGGASEKQSATATPVAAPYRSGSGATSIKQSATPPPFFRVLDKQPAAPPRPRADRSALRRPPEVLCDGMLPTNVECFASSVAAIVTSARSWMVEKFHLQASYTFEVVVFLLVTVL